MTSDFGLLLSALDNHWTQATFQPGSILSLYQHGLTLSLSNRKATYQNSVRTWEFAIPFGVVTPINCATAFTNLSKYYIEFIYYNPSNASASDGIGFLSMNRTRFDTIDGTDGSDIIYSMLYRNWGSAWSGQWQIYYKNGSAVSSTSGTTGSGGNGQPDFTTGTVNIGVGLDFSNGSTAPSTHLWN
jgi:hypothetical protein